MAGPSIINMKVKSMFFDSQKVIDIMDRKTRRAFAKFGAAVRTTARRQIKNPPKTKRTIFYNGRKIKTNASLPGKSPKTRTGLLKNSIFFSLDPSGRSVIIGPTKLSAKGRDVPHTLEFGGSITTATGRRVRIKPRPYMEPAFRKVLAKKKLPELWVGSVKGR